MLSLSPPRMPVVPLLVMLALFLTIPFSRTATAAAETYTEPLTKMEFVLIPGGTFTMGDSSGRDRWATPARSVEVKPFYMSKYETTFNNYKLFCTETKRPLPDDAGWGRGLRPVINVSWFDAVAFANWLTKKTGKSFRLPSEAEWEYAAAGGRNALYPWGNALGRSNANCRKCGSSWDGKSTATVGSFTANGYGLHDMAGNVYEWTQDAFHKNYEGAPTDGSVWKGKKKNLDRIYRGGSWFDIPQTMRIYTRCWDPASSKDNQIGFRLVMEP